MSAESSYAKDALTEREHAWLMRLSATQNVPSNHSRSALACDHDAGIVPSDACPPDLMTLVAFGPSSTWGISFVIRLVEQEIRGQLLILVTCEIGLNDQVALET